MCLSTVFGNHIFNKPRLSQLSKKKHARKLLCYTSNLTFTEKSRKGQNMCLYCSDLVFHIFLAYSLNWKHFLPQFETSETSALTSTWQTERHWPDSMWLVASKIVEPDQVQLIYIYNKQVQSKNHVALNCFESFQAFGVQSHRNKIYFYGQKLETYCVSVELQTNSV